MTPREALERAAKAQIHVRLSHDIMQPYHVRVSVAFGISFQSIPRKWTEEECYRQIREFLLSNNDWQNSYLTYEKASWPTCKEVAGVLLARLIERELKIEGIALPFIEELINV